MSLSPRLNAAVLAVATMLLSACVSRNIESTPPEAPARVVQAGDDTIPQAAAPAVEARISNRRSVESGLAAMPKPSRSGLAVYLLPEHRIGKDVSEQAKIFESCLGKPPSPKSRGHVAILFPLTKPTLGSPFGSSPEKSGLVYELVAGNGWQAYAMATDTPLAFPKCPW